MSWRTCFIIKRNRSNHSHTSILPTIVCSSHLIRSFIYLVVSHLSRPLVTLVVVSTYMWHPNPSPICPEGVNQIRSNPIYTYILPTVVRISHLTSSLITLIDSHLTRSLLKLVLSSTYLWQPNHSPICPEGYVSLLNISNQFQSIIYFNCRLICSERQIQSTPIHTFILSIVSSLHLTRSLIN